MRETQNKTRFIFIKRAPLRFSRNEAFSFRLPLPAERPAMQHGKVVEALGAVLLDSHCHA